jgi:hypothetical protein
MMPGAALADVPVNDTIAGAQVLAPSYSIVSSTTISPNGAGGWVGATSTEDSVLSATCLNQPSYNSMWYSLKVPEASVATITLNSGAVLRYQPVVTILDASGREIACGLGGSDQYTDPTASASTYVAAGQYFIRIAAVGPQAPGQSPAEAPTLRLTETLQDVSPPEIQVAVSGKTKIVGPGNRYRFDATASTDPGSGVSPSTATWTFPEDGVDTPLSPKDKTNNPQVVTHAWATAGVHKVTLKLSDKAGNTNSYTFDVLVHNFKPPIVSLLVYIPAPGARQVRIKLSHNVPINVRLSVLQGDRTLRVIPTRLVPGSRVSTILKIALTRKVQARGFVVVSGVASDIGEYPNTVPLLTCSVDPVHGGGKCA